MFSEGVVIAAAGFAAGLGVAMPLGAVAVLILRVGIVHGFRSAMAAAGAVALVDTLYCAAAVLAGALVAPAISSWGAAPRYLSGAVVVALGVFQLARARRFAPGTVSEQPRSRSVFLRFLALTAVNPLTLVYFLALAGIVTGTGDAVLAPVVFVVAAGLASLLWQSGLAAVASLFGAAVPHRVADTLGLAASILITGLGAAVIVATALTA